MCPATAPNDMIPAAPAVQLTPRRAQGLQGRPKTLAERRALARTHHMRGNLRRVPQESWDPSTAMTLLGLALAEFAQVGDFRGALVGRSDFQTRRNADGSLAFCHVSKAIWGSLHHRKTNIRIKATSARAVMRDAVAPYCLDVSGQSQLVQVGAQGQVVHMAMSRLWGDRTMRYACVEQAAAPECARDHRAVGHTTLLLRPVKPPVLILTNPVSVPAQLVQA